MNKKIIVYIGVAATALIIGFLLGLVLNNDAASVSTEKDQIERRLEASKSKEADLQDRLDSCIKVVEGTSGANVMYYLALEAISSNNNSSLERYLNEVRSYLDSYTAEDSENCREGL